MKQFQDSFLKKKLAPEIRVAFGMSSLPTLCQSRQEYSKLQVVHAIFCYMFEIGTSNLSVQIKKKIKAPKCTHTSRASQKNSSTSFRKPCCIISYRTRSRGCKRRANNTRAEYRLKMSCSRDIL